MEHAFRERGWGGRERERETHKLKKKSIRSAFRGVKMPIYSRHNYIGLISQTFMRTQLRSAKVAGKRYPSLRKDIENVENQTSKDAMNECGNVSGGRKPVFLNDTRN